MITKFWADALCWAPVQPSAGLTAFKPHSSLQTQVPVVVPVLEMRKPRSTYLPEVTLRKGLNAN